MTGIRIPQALTFVVSLSGTRNVMVRIQNLLIYATKHLVRIQANRDYNKENIIQYI
jgi:phage-related tail fiber protein